MPMPKLQFFDNFGAVCSGCLVYSYVAGTNTPQATYTTSTLGTPNANPVVLDSAGRPTTNIWLSANTYKIVLTDANQTQIWSVDNVAGQNGGIALALSSPPPIGNVTPNIVDMTHGNVGTSIELKDGVEPVNVTRFTGATADVQMAAAITYACASGAKAVSMFGMANTTIAATVSLGCSDGTPLQFIWDSSAPFVNSGNVAMFTVLPGADWHGGGTLNIQPTTAYSGNAVQLLGHPYDNQPGAIASSKGLTLPGKIVVTSIGNIAGTALYIEGIADGTSYVEFVDFDDISVVGMQFGIHAFSASNGWINSNTFRRLTCSLTVYCRAFETSGSASAINDNTFVVFENEYAGTAGAPQGVYGSWYTGTGAISGNQDLAVRMWDWFNAPTLKTVKIDATLSRADGNWMTGLIESAQIDDGTGLLNYYDSSTDFSGGIVVNITGSATFPFFNATGVGYKLNGTIALSSDDTHNAILDSLDNTGSAVLRSHSGSYKAFLDNTGSFRITGTQTTQALLNPFSSTITSGIMIDAEQDTSTFNGHVFYADMAHTTGTFTGNFLDFINNGSTKMSVAANGDITTNITGSTQCVHADSAGVISGTGSDCGSGGGGGVSGVTGAGVISSTGGATPAISLVNSTPANVTTAYGTDVGYFTGSGGAATLNHVMVGDAQGGIKDGLSSLPVYTPHQLGLLCNNSDEGAAIQTALNGLGGSTGGVLQLQPGDYCNTGTTKIVWPKQVSIRGTGPEGTGLWGVYQAASSALTVGCALDNYGCLELIDLGNAVFENLAIRNVNTCATFVHQTLMVAHFTNVSFVGKQGTKITNNACNDVFQFGLNITGCTTHVDCYFGGYGSTYTAITTEQVRRGAIFNTASAFINMSIVGSSTDSNSSADAQLITGTCNDASGKCGFSSLACSIGNVITLSSFDGGGTGATATVACTGPSAIADGTRITVTANGAGYTSAPTTATGTCPGHTCTGMASIAGFVLGPFVELLGYSGGGTNAIQNNILIFGEFGNASHHSDPGDGHYSTMIRTDFGGDNKAVVVGDDNAQVPYSAVADFISTSNGNGNNFECLYYQTGGSEPTKCISDSSLSSFHNHYIDGPLNKQYYLTNYQAHLGDSTLPVNDFTSAFFTVAGLSTGTGGSVLQKWVNDSSDGTCASGTGSGKVPCFYNGSTWKVFGEGTSPVFANPNIGNATGQTLSITTSIGAGRNLSSGTTNTDLAGTKASVLGMATYSFTGTYANPPVCILQNNTTPAGGITVRTVTNTSITATTTGATDVVSWICVTKG